MPFIRVACVLAESICDIFEMTLSFITTTGQVVCLPNIDEHALHFFPAFFAAYFFHRLSRSLATCDYVVMSS